MKNEIRLVLLCMAAVSAPTFAQDTSPLCWPTNFDQTRNAFTIVNPAADAVNQQCFLTVYPKGTMSSEVRQFPAGYPIEGTYVIELSGGGGGGGGGASMDRGGGGGGAGAAPSRTVQYLAPGVYKLTIGTGGEGGSADGGCTDSGNPTSMTNAYTGQLIAGFQGADVWAQRTQAASGGRGGVAATGGSSGGSGGDSSTKTKNYEETQTDCASQTGIYSGAPRQPRRESSRRGSVAAVAANSSGRGGDSSSRTEEAAHGGGASQTGGYSGTPGKSGSEGDRTVRIQKGGERIVQSNAGGGGGAGVGSGGFGESTNKNAVAGIGDLGGGGGGGRGGDITADAGGRGGHGFIRLTMSLPAPQAAAPAPTIVMQIPMIQRYSLSADMLFVFGKSTLKPSGKAKLDELVSQLKDVNVDSITFTGHADRIGSSESNHELSLNRAKSVKAYLVSQGVQSDHITVVGKGETEPVTGSDDCNGATTPKVIACLGPDRRVDIEVVVRTKQ